MLIVLTPLVMVTMFRHDYLTQLAVGFMVCEAVDHGLLLHGQFVEILPVVGLPLNRAATARRAHRRRATILSVLCLKSQLHLLL